MGMMPKKTKAETKVYRNLTLARIFGLIISLLTGFLISKIVYYRFAPLVIILTVLFYFISSGKTPYKSKKTFYSGLKDYCCFLRRKRIYYGSQTKEVKESEAYYNEKSKKQSKRKEKVHNS